MGSLCAAWAAPAGQPEEERGNERGDGEKEEEVGEGDNPRMETDLGAITHFPRKGCEPLPFPPSHRLLPS